MSCPESAAVLERISPGNALKIAEAGVGWTLAVFVSNVVVILSLKEVQCFMFCLTLMVFKPHRQARDNCIIEQIVLLRRLIVKTDYKLQYSSD